MTRKLIVFFGPPGVGKGTLSQKLMEKINCVQLSTGNLLRKHLLDQTLIGREIDFVLKSGKLIADDLIIKMVIEWLQNEAQDASYIILDGFPRTLVQAKSFISLLALRYPLDVLCVIRLFLSDDEIVMRILSRLICSNSVCQMVYSDRDDLYKSQKDGICDLCQSLLIKRNDDTRNTISVRLNSYYEYEQELIMYYESIGQSVKVIDAQCSMVSIVNDVLKIIGAMRDSD